MTDRWSTIRWLAGPFLGPVYRRVIAAKNRRFDAREGVERLPVPVISVGNLSTGGTGKTPLVAWVVRRLAERGVRGVIAMRGYRRDAAGRSDEAEEYGRLLPGTAVVADPARHAAVTRYLQERGAAAADAVVLDDGFQHRQLHRDVDIVLVDATRDPFTDSLLPGGNLREPVESLSRAHAVVVTHAEAAGPGAAEALCTRVRGVSARAVVAVCRHAWRGVMVLENGAEREETLAWLGSRRVMPACAIGNPGAFLAEAARRGSVVEAFVRPDHDPFAPATVERLIATAKDRGAEAILITEKDWSKLQYVDSSLWPCPVARVRLEVEFVSGEEAVLGVVMNGVGREEAQKRRNAETRK